MHRINQFRLVVVSGDKQRKRSIAVGPLSVSVKSFPFNHFSLCFRNGQGSGVLLCGGVPVILHGDGVVGAVGFQGKVIGSGIGAFLRPGHQSQSPGNGAYIVTAHQRGVSVSINHNGDIPDGNLGEFLAVGGVHIHILHLDGNRAFLNGGCHPENHILVDVAVGCYIGGKGYLAGLCGAYF